MGRARTWTRRSQGPLSTLAWWPRCFLLAWVLVLALGSSLGCATTGRTQREAAMSILHKRPVSGCTSVGPVSGEGGGFGGAWLDNKTLETYATNALLKQAADQGATHVFITGTDYKKSQSGGTETATVTGEAFICQGELVFAAAKPPPDASPPLAGKTTPVASALRAVDHRLWSSWQGTVTQPGYGSFDVELSLSHSGASGVCGAAEYRSLGCRGVLTHCQVNGDGTIEVEQRLDVVGKCVDRGKIRLKREGSVLNAAFALPDGRTVAQGTLSLQSHEHALLNASRHALAALPARREPVSDDEIFEALPQFLPAVLPAGFVTDEPPITRVGADGRFRVVRSYQRQDGAMVMLAILLVRSNYEGASATLSALENGNGATTRLAGFPALRRLTPARGRKLTYVVLSPRLQVEIDATGVSEDAFEGLLRGLSLAYLAQVESHGQLAVASLTQSKEFEDLQGQKVRVASGQSAFADRLVGTEVGARQGPKRDGNLSLGPPDYDGGRGYYSLGCRGKLTVAFEDNVLEDGPGQDLHIFEVGGFVETIGVRISENSEQWLDAGQVKGQPASLDIGGIGPAGTQYRFVELTDMGTECGNEQAGADIDAIGALHGEIVATPKTLWARSNKSKPKAQQASPVEDPRRIAEAVQRSEGVPLEMDVKGRDWTLSEAKGGYSVRSSGSVLGDVNGDGIRDVVVITTRGDAQRQEHQLEVYTERGKGLGPLAQAVIGYDDPTPSAGSLKVAGSRIQFSMSGAAFAYELRHGSLIRLEP